MKLKPWVLAAGASEGGLDLGLSADEVEFGDVRVGLQRQFDAIDDDFDSVVATHDIHDDSHKWKERRRASARTALLKLTRRL